MQALARKHHTSKIADFSDLHSLTTFGFRGEALSSLCALGNLTIETRTKGEPIGTRLTYDHSGAVKTESKTARQVGTTVTVEKLFSTLPVRHREFSRNIRREYGKLISLLNVGHPFSTVFNIPFTLKSMNLIIFLVLVWFIDQREVKRQFPLVLFSL